MPSKQLLFALFFLAFLPYNTHAETDHPELRQTFAQYFTYLETKDVSKTLDLIYPKLFDHYPRPLLEAAVKSMDEDTLTLITFSVPAIEKIAPVLELDGIQYTRLDYNYHMHIVIREEPEDPDKDDDGEADFKLDGSLAELTFAVLKGEYGEKNAQFDPATGTIDILANKQLFAILDPAYDGWKFLEKKDSMKEVLEKLLPAKVLKKL